MNKKDGEDDDLPEELKALFGSGLLAAILGKVLGNLGGKGNEISFGDRKVTEEEKEKMRKLEERVKTRYDQFAAACHRAGVTLVGMSRTPLHGISVYGGLTVYDEPVGRVGALLDDVCINSILVDPAYAPDSDEELYAENQLRPEGVQPSLVVIMIPVHKEIPSMFAGAFGPPPDKKDMDIVEFLFDALVANFYRVKTKKRTQHAADHHHYDLELLVREEYTRADVLGKEPFVLPALPHDQTSVLDFISSLEFMDENPESGG